jgi:pyrophosphatase PpaX
VRGIPFAARYSAPSTSSAASTTKSAEPVPTVVPPAGARWHTPALADLAATFDLDGTLVDLRDVYVRAHQLAAREVLSRELEEARVLELMGTGMPIRAHMALLDEAAADRLVEVFVDRYRVEREGLARSFPGVEQMLTGLRADGVRVAVVTSKLRADASAELLATGIDKHVDALVAFEDTTEHKPHPEPHIRALTALSARGGVGVGDLPTDIASARAAGLTAIGVSWGYGRPDALLEAGATFVCTSAVELERQVRCQLQVDYRRVGVGS